MTEMKLIEVMRQNYERNTQEIIALLTFIRSRPEAEQIDLFEYLITHYGTDDHRETEDSELLEDTLTADWTDERFRSAMTSAKDEYADFIVKIADEQPSARDFAERLKAILDPIAGTDKELGFMVLLLMTEARFIPYVVVGENARKAWNDSELKLEERCQRLYLKLVAAETIKNNTGLFCNPMAVGFFSLDEIVFSEADPVDQAIIFSWYQQGGGNYDSARPLQEEALGKFGELEEIMRRKYFRRSTKAQAILDFVDSFAAADKNDLFAYLFEYESIFAFKGEEIDDNSGDRAWDILANSVAEQVILLSNRVKKQNPTLSELAEIYIEELYTRIKDPAERMVFLGLSMQPMMGFMPYRQRSTKAMEYSAAIEQGQFAPEITKEILFTGKYKAILEKIEKTAKVKLLYKNSLALAIEQLEIINEVKDITIRVPLLAWMGKNKCETCLVSDECPMNEEAQNPLRLSRLIMDDEGKFIFLGTSSPDSRLNNGISKEMAKTLTSALRGAMRR